ncbi:MAG: hypothetical protein MUO64_12010 [Anaerolineales bacterium]|nr:hypothetical protein [Anaerolineales bacterium]
MSNTTDQLLSQHIAQLKAEGANGLEQYEKKLRSNTKNPAVLGDLLFEGRAALMFLRNGFRVAMRERPDLQIELDKEVVGVEVKHFHEKEQDRVDEKAMLEATELLVLIGDLTESEGAPAWTQIANVAIRKASQYMSDAPNILIVESSSESLELMLPSAVHEYDVEVFKSNDPCLRRLNAMMLINTRSIGFRSSARVGSSGPWNVEFYQTAHATAPLSAKLVSALTNVRLD